MRQNQHKTSEGINYNSKYFWDGFVFFEDHLQFFAATYLRCLAPAAAAAYPQIIECNPKKKEKPFAAAAVSQF